MSSRGCRPMCAEYQTERSFRFEEIPFPHIKIAPLISVKEAEELLRLLDNMVWKRTTQEFYEFNIPTDLDKKTLQHLLSSWRIGDRIRTYLQSYLDVHLGGEAIIDSHQYVPGTGIGVHTDGSAREARFVLNLNRGWQSSQGGVWVLSQNSNLKQFARYLPPLHNTGFGFLTRGGSYHALSERFSSSSYAVIFRFRIKRNDS